MLTVKPTRDLDLMMDTLRKPSVWRGASGDSEVISDVKQILSEPNSHYFAVQDEGRNLGFTAYIYVQKGVYAIHNCLLTFGSRTVAAIKDSLKQMKAMGADIIISAYPETNRAAKAKAAVLGFKDDETGFVKKLLPIHSDSPYLYQYLKLN